MEAELLEHFEAVIAEHGHAVVGVFDPDGIDTPFAYTVGLTAKGRPELLISGLPAEMAQTLLNDAAEAWTEEWTTGTVVDGLLRDGYQFTVVNGTPTEALTLGAVHALYGEFRVQQLVWPDRDRHWPWDHEYNDEGAWQQPLIERSDGR